ncbi:succinate dehydrogenase cytochrome b560 subunit, mitochondrial-like [Styela clava]|uniref:succinate dehydrogenase cytochrome b560 subunit, mitochondrial-like n=1 Tax=Styela clava TaxID=7725 RepID=UPI00193A3154|nr:succinate dehydrogenase cytochrome b560 subunit, mitochondrial-like [Styela clava]
MALLSQIGRNHGRILALTRPLAFSGYVAPKSTGTAQEQIDEFWNKNKTLNRPMSPHITVYNLHHVTSAMSLTHRATGIFLAGAVSAFAFASPLLPKNLDEVILSFQSWGDTWIGYLAIMDFKICLVLPIVFHTLNGLRHLAWDTGKGFEMSDLRKSGYATVGLSLLISIMIVLGCRST